MVNIGTLTSAKYCAFLVYLEMKPIWKHAWLLLTVYVDPGRLENGSGPKCGPLVLTVDHSVLLSSFCGRLCGLKNAERNRIEAFCTWRHVIPHQKEAVATFLKKKIQTVSHTNCKWLAFPNSYFTTNLEIKFCIGPEIVYSLMLLTDPYRRPGTKFT